MATLNNCRFIGRIGKKPEIRQMNNGKSCASFSIAVDESYKKDGEKVSKAEWINIIVFSEGLVKVIENYADKGSLIYLEGKMQTRKWTDKDGVDKYTTEIVLQGFNSTIQLVGGKGLQDAGIDKALDVVDESKTNGFQPEDDMDDSVPF